MTIVRAPQRVAAFTPGDPTAGYYNDLRPVLANHTAEDVGSRIASGALARSGAVAILQAGLAAWQSSVDDDSWLCVVDEAARWARAAMDPDGRLAYTFPMPHTFRLDPPWYSAMAQGQAASLLVRSAVALERDDDLAAASAAVRSLVDPRLGLVVSMPEGPVLQEYPTAPPAHVLNGWIFALWGLYDAELASMSDGGGLRAAFAAGSESLVRRLALYELPGGWSRYDLYPHPVSNVASPFYHRLHVAQLRVMARLTGEGTFASTAGRWEHAADRPLVRTVALGRKCAFRIVRPRWRCRR